MLLVGIALGGGHLGRQSDGVDVAGPRRAQGEVLHLQNTLDVGRYVVGEEGVEVGDLRLGLVAQGVDGHGDANGLAVGEADSARHVLGDVAVGRLDGDFIGLELDLVVDAQQVCDVGGQHRHLAFHAHLARDAGAQGRAHAERRLIGREGDGPVGRGYSHGTALMQVQSVGRVQVLHDHGAADARPVGHDREGNTRQRADVATEGHVVILGPGAHAHRRLGAQRRALLDLH